MREAANKQQSQVQTCSRHILVCAC